jgi:hypothetical protein
MSMDSGRPSESQASLPADQNYMTGWANLLRGNGRICHNIESFLADFVPCDEPVPLNLRDWDLFVDYKPGGSIGDCDGMVRFTTQLREFSPTGT